MTADDRACTPVSLQNLNGTEGVNGSSPSESFFEQKNCPQMGDSCCQSKNRRPLSARHSGARGQAPLLRR
jgi:hypothetical protein